MQINHSPSHRDDRGFTLVELLIVIVILGILTTVTVFAVRGITDKGQENSEGTDLDTLETAIDAYWMNEGSNPTEAQLVSAGYLTEESSLHDIAVAGDGSYTITNVRTGAAVSNGEAGSSTTATTIPTVPTSGVNGWLGTPTTVGGLPAVSYGDGSVPVRIVMYGGADAKAIWNDKVSNGVPSDYDLTIIDKSLLTSAAIVADAQAADGNNSLYLVTNNEPAPSFTGGLPLFIFMGQRDPSLSSMDTQSLASWFQPA